MRSVHALLFAAAVMSFAGSVVGADADTSKGTGNLRYTISVKKFENEAGWSGQWDLGNGFNTIMTHALNQSGHFVVLGDDEMRGAAMAEQDLATTGRVAGGKKTPATGRMTPAQLLVRGSITHVQDTTASGSGGINFKGFRLGGGGGKAEINCTIYLVDTVTGQVKASTDVVGVSGRKGGNIGYSGSALGGLGGDLEGFQADNMGKATEDAVRQGVEFLTKQLESVQWQGSVVLASPAKILINRGTRDGVAVGNRFAVGNAEEVVDPDTGETLDSSVTQVGEIEVAEVKEKVATCKAISGGDAIQKGMSVAPVAAK